MRRLAVAREKKATTAIVTSTSAAKVMIKATPLPEECKRDALATGGMGFMPFREVEWFC